MRIIFFLLFICLFAYSKGQDSKIRIGDRTFNTILLSDKLAIYSASCEDQQDYLFASNTVLRFDSATKKGYLSSYSYADTFFCRKDIDRSTVDQIQSLVSKKTNNRSRIGLLFSMEDKNNKFIAVLFLLKKRKFKKFVKKANKIKTRNYAGENITIRDYDYRFAKEFILIKTGNKLSLLSTKN